MRQTFMVVLDAESEIEIGQIALPIMGALKLEIITVEKAVQPAFAPGRFALVRVYDKSEVEEIGVGEYQLKPAARRKDGE